VAVRSGPETPRGASFHRSGGWGNLLQTALLEFLPPHGHEGLLLADAVGAAHNVGVALDGYLPVFVNGNEAFITL